MKRLLSIIITFTILFNTGTVAFATAPTSIMVNGTEYIEVANIGMNNEAGNKTIIRPNDASAYSKGIVYFTFKHTQKIAKKVDINFNVNTGWHFRPGAGYVAYCAIKANGEFELYESGGAIYTISGIQVEATYIYTMLIDTMNSTYSVYINEVDGTLLGSITNKNFPVEINTFKYPKIEYPKDEATTTDYACKIIERKPSVSAYGLDENNISTIDGLVNYENPKIYVKLSDVVVDSASVSENSLGLYDGENEILSSVSFNEADNSFILTTDTVLKPNKKYSLKFSDNLKTVRRLSIGESLESIDVKTMKLPYSINDAWISRVSSDANADFDVVVEINNRNSEPKDNAVMVAVYDENNALFCINYLTIKNPNDKHQYIVPLKAPSNFEAMSIKVVLIEGFINQKYVDSVSISGI